MKTFVALLTIVTLLAFLPTRNVQAWVPCGSPQQTGSSPFYASNFPLKVWINPDGYNANLTYEQLSAAVDRAMAAWTNLPDSNITFQRVATSSAAKVRVEVVPDNWFAPPPPRASSQCNPGPFSGFDDSQFMRIRATVNDWDFDVSDGITPGKPSLDFVLTHEFGHILGLAHTCTIPNGIMCVVDSDPTSTVGRNPPIDADSQAAMAAFYPMQGAPTPTPVVPTPTPVLPTATPLPQATPTPVPAGPVLIGCQITKVYSNGMIVNTALNVLGCGP